MRKHVPVFAVFAGCQPGAPATPSFQQDVLPILAANCVRCHGAPALGGSPPSMRLDVYGDIAVDDTTKHAGAARLAPLIALRIVSETQPMPPRFPLDDYQIATLQNWAAGVPAGDLAPRGQPRPDNHVPRIAITRIAQAGDWISIQSAIDDSDGDLVAGELRATINGSERIVGSVRSGLVEVHWNSTGVAAGTYPWFAHLDDGAQVHVLTLGTLTVGGP